MGAVHRRLDNLQAETGQRAVQFGGEDRVVVMDDEAILVVGRDGFSKLHLTQRD